MRWESILDKDNKGFSAVAMALGAVVSQGLEDRLTKLIWLLSPVESMFLPRVESMFLPRKQPSARPAGFETAATSERCQDPFELYFFLGRAQNPTRKTLERPIRGFKVLRTPLEKEAP